MSFKVSGPAAIGNGIAHQLNARPATFPENTAQHRLAVYSVSPDLSLYLLAYFGEGTVKAMGGAGGWKSVAKPKDQPLTKWLGPEESFTYEIPLILGDYRLGDSNATKLSILTLQKMSGEMSGEEPPQLVIDAAGTLMHDVQHSPHLTWVIPGSPDWGQQYLNPNGEIVQAAVTVKFMVYRTGDLLARGKESAPRRTYYVAKSGQTYDHIAAAALGSARYGNKLAKLNNARDGHSKPLVGQKVLLPTPAQLKDWSKNAGAGRK